MRKKSIPEELGAKTFSSLTLLINSNLWISSHIYYILPYIFILSRRVSSQPNLQFQKEKATGPPKWQAAQKKAKKTPPNTPKGTGGDLVVMCALSCSLLFN